MSFFLKRFKKFGKKELPNGNTIDIFLILIGIEVDIDVRDIGFKRWN